MNNLQSRLVVTPHELIEAQKLRFDVFNREINHEAQANVGVEELDVDEFDAICDHLIIVDQSQNKVVGTYRLLLEDKALANHGFYTATKFNMKNFESLPGIKLEVGRSCVHKDYRNRSVLNLLWQGICQYAMKHNVRYIFGSSNIMTSDPHAINRFFATFKALGLFEDLGIGAKDPLKAITLDETVTIEDPKIAFEELPVLFKAYLTVGLKVCGHPVMGDFHTALFPVFLDIPHTKEPFKKRFFGDYSPKLK